MSSRLMDKVLRPYRLFDRLVDKAFQPLRESGERLLTDLERRRETANAYDIARYGSLSSARSSEIKDLSDFFEKVAQVFEAPYAGIDLRNSQPPSQAERFSWFSRGFNVQAAIPPTTFDFKLPKVELTKLPPVLSADGAAMLDDGKDLMLEQRPATQSAQDPTYTPPQVRPPQF